MARPDDGSPGGTQTGGAEIRLAFRLIFDLGLKRFVLPAANILQVDPLGACRSLLVEIDRDIQLAADPLTQPAGHGHTFRHLNPGQRDEGYHVGGTQARVGAGMLVEVDQFSGFAYAEEGGLLHGSGWAGKGYHGAIVVIVGGLVQQGDLRHTGDGGDDGFNDFRTAGFGKVGDAFDKGIGHGLLHTGRSIIPYAQRQLFSEADPFISVPVLYNHH